MARTKGMLNLSGNLEVNAGAPLDARSVVPTVADLTVASNFQYKYVGMPVVVQATGDMYILTANDVTVAANWKQVGSGGGGSSYTAGDGIVIDNDEISTDNMPAADMPEIINPLPSVMLRLPILFDETGAEQIVGWYKYSDGTRKPCYQKTATLTPIVSGVEIASNVDVFANAPQIIRKFSSTSEFISTDCGAAGTNAIIFKLNNNILYVCAQTSSYNAGQAIVTVQYTKTTDTAI